MFRIIGDGSHNNTKILKNNEEIKYIKCSIDFRVGVTQGSADVDGEVGYIDFVYLNGIYKLISDDGRSDNTHLYIYDLELRGIQRVLIDIQSGEHTMFVVEGVFLPNIVPIKENDGKIT
jgi:hypothetical protein